MRLLRILFFILATVCTGWTQSSDIYARLRHACSNQSEGEAAAAQLAKRQFGEVQVLLEKQRANDPVAQAELLAVQGAVAFLAGELNKSVSAYDKAAALSPLKSEDQFTLAMALIGTGRPDRARGLLEVLASQHSDQALYPYWLGRLDYDAHRYSEAVSEFRRALVLDPKSTRAWNSLGLTFDMTGESDQARDALERAVALNRAQTSPSPWPPHDLGYLLLRTEHFPEAEASLRESLRYRPELMQAHLHLGRVLEKQGRSEEAVQQYLAAVSGNRADPDACYSLALLYRKLRQDKEATAMFDEYRRRKQQSAR